MNKNILSIAVVSVLLLTVFSCKKKHNVEEATPDYIVGEWQLERIQVGTAEYPVNDCMRRSRIYFSSNHEESDKYYTIYQSTNQCELHLEHTGHWEYNNGKFYLVIETEGNTVLTTPRRNEIFFTDKEHAHVDQSYNGITGTFYFHKLNEGE